MQNLQLQEEPEQHPVERILPTERDPALDVEDLVRQLSSNKQEVRAAAEKRLASHGPTAAEALLKALEAEGAKYRKQSRAFRTAGMTVAGIVLALLLVCVGIGIATGNWEPMNTFGSFGGVFGTVGAAAAMSRQHKSIVSLVANLDDVRSVGWLIDALSTEDKSLRSVVEDALLRLLPRLSASDGSMLDNDRRRALDRRLLKSENQGLVLQILRTYEMLGDSKSLEAVTSVGEGRGKVKIDGIENLARQVADEIRARAEKEQQAQILLRPTESVAESEALLRPAVGAGEKDGSELLRPVDSASDEDVHGTVSIST